MIRATLTALIAMVCSLPAWAVEIQEVTSPGGITAWLVEDSSIPFVALDIRFQGGTSMDAPEDRGAVYLMTGLLEEGAGELDAQGFAQATEALAAGFSFNAYRDSVSVSVEMLTQNRDQAADLLRQALITPRFDQDAFDRVRGQVMALIESNLQDPDSIAQERFNALAFGAHPYGSSQLGTVETVSALTREDMVATHTAVFARDRVYVGAAGDISAEELGLLLDTLLGDLPAEGAPLPGPAEYLLEGGTTVVDFPTPQSVAVFGHRGIERTDPDFFPAFVLNQIMGGGNFRSRLMREVRIARGLTYGIYSYLALSDHQPMIAGQFSSSNDLVAEAVAVTRDQWADIAANGVTDEELRDAITFMTGAYPLRFDGNDTIAGIMAGMQQDGMPVDYIATRNAQVEAVTMDDIRRVAGEFLQPDGLHFVVVGQPEGLGPSN
ncbi:insulinase family protein [Roseobacter sp. HKCCD9010]|uniref:M16 family metallopeptidase n=1 Tax=unclassified Roseobacter TaxID=196798 RepID=UPI001492B50D|nr:MULTISPECIES: pitrilysin family protein [unclassified Roseobacter]MBF9048600.1 insulinase family protein [Rhodobacterales bacterium HKCCD4356]NNV10599.1 insulinase family protein [Roseobacter sp. HKCCD7357]NNV14784.1 insulinase family protein [Roseobacter sp. HKCCD8768]NNV24243.1 insulinase family protein [Roseobacter sp. HKCCD8192]NNV28500.1 insulinase family protein [Roseobacter sp. HKCCD9061]